jgi:hypothetical protein
MSPSELEFLINLIGQNISKNDTAFRKAISVQERLALTLRSRNCTTRQIRTTLQDGSTRNEKNSRGAEVVTFHAARSHLLRL